MNRYSHAANNPVKYTDPTGHVWWIAAGAVAGAAIVYSAQVVGNLDQGMDHGAALTTDIDATTIVGGALAGASLVALAPVALSMAGEAIVGVGLLSGSTSAVSAGVGVTGAGATLGGYVYGLSSPAQNEVSASSRPASAPVRGENPAARAGREAHQEFASRVQTKSGWQSEPRLVDPQTGKTVIPDAVSP